MPTMPITTEPAGETIGKIVEFPTVREPNGPEENRSFAGGRRCGSNH